MSKFILRVSYPDQTTESVLDGDVARTCLFYAQNMYGLDNACLYELTEAEVESLR